MRIYCQLPVRMPRADKRFSPYYTLVEKNYGLVKRKDTEITIRDVKGFDSPEWTQYTGLRLFNDAQILKSLIAAEQEGFDGISIACFLDPALDEARQLLTIPVTGLAESSLHLACMMGNKFAIITSSDRFIPAIE
jgi:allantoin racemase